MNIVTYYLEIRNNTTDKKQQVVEKAQGRPMLSRYIVSHKEII